MTDCMINGKKGDGQREGTTERKMREMRWSTGRINRWWIDGTMAGRGGMTCTSICNRWQTCLQSAGCSRSCTWFFIISLDSFKSESVGTIGYLFHGYASTGNANCHMYGILQNSVWAHKITFADMLHPHSEGNVSKRDRAAEWTM